MARGDIKVLEQNNLAGRGAKKYNTLASTIYAGEPVFANKGQVSKVYPAWSNGPVVGSDYFVGIASTDSTSTTTVGIVGVVPAIPGTIYLISPKVAATFGQGTTQNQDTYDSQVGKRVLIDLTSGSYTLLAADSATNGVIIEPLDITRYPGKVAISFRAGAIYEYTAQ